MELTRRVEALLSAFSAGDVLAFVHHVQAALLEKSSFKLLQEHLTGSSELVRAAVTTHSRRERISCSTALESFHTASQAQDHAAPLFLLHCVEVRVLRPGRCCCVQAAYKLAASA